MEYKGFEIYARVYESNSDLYTLTKDGELDESLDIKIDNGDQSIVWYETDSDHVLDGFDSPFGFKTIQNCKEAIDRWTEEYEQWND